jgi:hypothetical protein
MAHWPNGADSQKYIGRFKTWYESCKYLAETLLSAVNSRGHLEVEIASQISPAFIGHFYKMNNGWTTSTAEMVVGEHDIVCADVTGAVVGSSAIVSDVTSERFFYGHVLAVNGLTVTVDAEIDFPYLSGSDVAFASHDMNVNGLVTHQIFGIRQAENPANRQTTIELDITRVMHRLPLTLIGM